MTKLASWNVNSLKVRLPQVLNFLENTQTDVLALQETKVVDAQFPLQDFLSLGYHVTFSGQPTYNGVAIISKHPITDVVTDLPDFEDSQRRLIAATIEGIRVVNVYVPNGSELTSDKYIYKLSWLEKLNQFIKQELQTHPKLVIMGDFNIAPEDCDVHNPKAWVGSVLVSPKERQALSDLLALGLTDSFRLFEQEEESYSWWDYRAAAFRRNNGLRIDLILVSDALKAQCTTSQIDKEPRKDERPSDHAPVWVVL